MNQMRQMLMADPVQFEMIKARFPEMANAIQRNDSGAMMRLMSQLAGSDQQYLSQGTHDPIDLDGQKRMLEHIRLQNIQQNMESALEYMPEAFGNVVMLYIDCQVNGHHVKAFVDSGAQMTIMSAACAERCGIMRLVDTRWAGIAKGVGTQKIVGRVHLAQIQIETSFLTGAFSILEEQPMDMLLGLDILKRHQCIIDLQQNKLIFKSANIETKFLPENELPSFARGNHVEAADDEVMYDNQGNPMTSSASKTEKAKTELPANVTEASVQNLVKMGFKRDAVIEALGKSNGDESNATIALLASSLSSPK
jgi:DNA damage-inducible protein 1